ncbi:MAG: hypothetical protein BWX74_00321 [Tenericutes bacterium ADurb.Bin087]|nr:MAG: hypothetical protein BWX74_00321 [Tenericutes bacterium ADurb.Bin087]
MDREIGFRKTAINEYLDRLLRALNTYEGYSDGFRLLNSEFINYLKARWVLLDDEKGNEIRIKFQRDRDYLAHPFLGIVIRQLEGARIHVPQREETLKLLKCHPNYPLYNFINFAFTFNRNDKDAPFEILSEDFIKIIFYLTNKKGYPHLENFDSFLEHKLRTSGVSMINLVFARRSALLQKNMDKVSEHLSLAAIQSGQEPYKFLGQHYYELATLFKKYNVFAGKLLQKAVDLKNYDALLPLVNYYEKASDENNDYTALAFYYLIVAHHLGVAGAKEKLQVYYEKGGAMPPSDVILHKFFND